MLADREADAVAVAAHLLVSDPGQGDWARATLRRAARRAEALGDPSDVCALPGARRGRAPRFRRARRDPVRAGPGGRPRRPPRRRRAPGARGRGGRAHPPAGAALDRGAAPGRGAREQGSRRARGRARRRARGGRGGEAPARDADRGRVRQRHGPAPARRHLLPPEGAPRNPADRLRALRADHGGVPGRRGGIGRRPRDRPGPPGARRRGARLLRVRDAGERRAADALVHPHSAGALRRVARDPRRARPRRPRLRRPLGRRRLPGGARVDAGTARATRREPRPTPPRRSGSRARRPVPAATRRLRHPWRSSPAWSGSGPSRSSRRSWPRCRRRATRTRWSRTISRSRAHG